MKKGNLTARELEEYTRVAYYYYKADFTQEEIAKRMQMSRQRVNRILASCIDLGIVKISIANLGSDLELETALERKYGLRCVRVVENVVESKVHEDLGIAAGECLASFIRKGDIIGFTRGRSTSALVDYMPPVSKDNLTITQLLGSAHKDTQASSHLEVDDIVYRFSLKLHAKPSMLYAPVIVQDAALRESLMKDPYFQQGYDIIKACNIAVVGIGTADSQVGFMTEVLGEAPTRGSMDWARDVAGEICTHFFDAKGREVFPPFSDRIISISLEDYIKIPIRIGVAGLPYKAGAIRAAIKGGYINVLVTDKKTASILIG